MTTLSGVENVPTRKLRFLRVLAVKFISCASDPMNLFFGILFLFRPTSTVVFITRIKVLKVVLRTGYFKGKRLNFHFENNGASERVFFFGLNFSMLASTI